MTSSCIIFGKKFNVVILWFNTFPLKNIDILTKGLHSAVFILQCTNLRLGPVLAGAAEIEGR
ncbi:unnamed protein product [Prunus armeniaca]